MRGGGVLQCACCLGRKWRREDCLISFSQGCHKVLSLSFFFFLHTQLHLLFQVHFAGRVHTEAQRCTNKHKRIPETSAFLMGKKETICVFVLT